MQAVAIAMRGKNKTGKAKRGNQFRKICSTEEPPKQNTGKNGVCGEMLGRQERILWGGRLECGQSLCSCRMNRERCLKIYYQQGLR